jgi:hypothetical protein
MKYLCAVYLEPNALQGLSAGEQAKLNRDSLDYDEELAKKGRKEVLGGFTLIEARDMEEAVRIAENIPVAKFASIEMRPKTKIG